MFSAGSDSGSTRISAWMLSAFPSRRILVPWTSGSRATSAARRRTSGASAEASPEIGRTRIEIAPASPCPGPVICDERMSFPATIGDDRGICSSVRLSVSSEIAGSVSTIRRPADAQNQSERPAHDPPDPAGPELASPVALGARAAADPAAVDAPPEQVQERGEQRGRRQDGDRHHHHRPRRHRLHGPHRHEPQRQQGQDDREAREDDGRARRPHRRVDRVVGRGAGLELLAEPGEDEHRVVDGDADPDHRHHRRHEDRHLGGRRGEEDRPERDDDRCDRERERQRRGDERAEEGDEDDRDERGRQGLRARQVGLDDPLEGGVEGGRAEDVDPRRAVCHLDAVGAAGG